MTMRTEAALLLLLLAPAILTAPSSAFQPVPQLRSPARPLSTKRNYYISDADEANNALVGGRMNPVPALIEDQRPDASLIAEHAAFAEDLADAARGEILPYWRKSIDVENKAEEGRSLAQTISPVTAADRAAEMAMRTLIEARYPNHGIYGEEYGSVRTDAEWVWVLDPIDGTKSFVTGKPVFGTLVSCLYRGAPVVGLIDQCILKERWVGALGCPTTLNGTPVHVGSDTARRLGEATVYTTTPDMFRQGEEIGKFDTMRLASKRTLYGCDCYAYALVASGFGADAVVEADLGLYDYCALVPVVEGAGGIMSDWRGERLTLQNHGGSEGRVVACSNDELHAELLAILSRPWAPEEGWLPQELRTLLMGAIVGAALSHGI